jgi:hypothetical protein
MCTVLLPPGVNPITVNKYVSINNKVHGSVKFRSTGVYIFSILFYGFAYVCAVGVVFCLCVLYCKTLVFIQFKSRHYTAQSHMVFVFRSVKTNVSI